MNYFTNDMRFSHKRLLGENSFAPRLFTDTDETNQRLITSWSAVVKETDRVYHLGDFAMHLQYEKANTDILELVSQLQRTIHLIERDHDGYTLSRYSGKSDPGLSDGSPRFYFYDVGVIVKFDHQQYYSAYYPMLSGPNDTIRNLHGHIHCHSAPIENVVNVDADALERDLLKERLLFGTSLSKKQIKEIYEVEKSRESCPTSSDEDR